MKLKLHVLSTLLTFGLAFGARSAVILQDNFDAYPIGPLPTNDITQSPWVGNTGTPATGGVGGIQVVADPTGGSGNALQVSQSLSQDIKALIATNTTLADVIVTNGTGVNTNFTFGFSPSNSVGALYESMDIYVTAPPTSSAPTYFTHFLGDPSNFRAKLFIITNGAASGSFRIAIQNGGNAITNVLPVDLSPNTSYKIVTRYVLSSSLSTLWLNPTSESSTTSANGGDTQTPVVMHAYSFRQASPEGTIDADNLLVGTTFADVIPGSVNLPIFITQPSDTNVFASATVILKSLALGDPTITYQWYFNTNVLLSDNGTTIAGSTSNILTLTNLDTIQSGTYSVVASNPAGTNVTRFASIIVSPTPIPPVITGEPTNVTVTVGDNASLTVTATGLPAPSYQWKYITNNGVSFFTNNVSGANITGTNSSTLTFSGIQLGQAGSYFVTVSNIAGYKTTNSTVATVTVTPPPAISIADFRSRVDGTFAPTNTTALFTLEGTVTTWSDMTGKANTEFFMQDASGGIAVFWSGADGTTNLPPAGAIVRVTGAMAAFNGLLEIEPVFTNTLTGVTVLSTNNPLPTPQPLPFDPNITSDLATMKKMEGMYFVASNVTLTAGTTFTSGANEPIINNRLGVKTFSDTALTVQFTNDVGQTFTLFVNASTDIPNKAKPPGAVTIFGVLGFFTAQGFEFTPSRYADIVSYVHATNIVTHVKHYGDLLTNSYSENVLRTGETLTTVEQIGDVDGGIVTVTPDLSTLPPSATWDTITSGTTASATFHFTPTAGDAGSNYVVNLQANSTSGASLTNKFTVYVPTATEQQMAVTEFLANPTTNSALPNFNPLHRPTDTIAITTNDIYVEIANRSTTPVDFSDWLLIQGANTIMDFDAVNPNPPTLAGTSAMVIYAGNPGETPTLASSAFRSTGTGFILPNTGGTIVLRNGKGNIVDRVIYAASDLSTNGSLSRFPTIDSPFVRQEYISTNNTTAGLQYDGNLWSLPTQVPAGVSNIVTIADGAISLTFTADPAKMNTLWSATTLTDTFKPVAGKQFSTGSGLFTISNAPSPADFFFITSQSNYVTSP